jgi:hypothetical protein
VRLHPKKIFRNSSAAEDVVTEELKKNLLLHKNIFCKSSDSFAPNKYFRSGKNIYASRRISTSEEDQSFICGDISSACEDVIKTSKFYRRYIFCARRNIFCA